MKKFVFFLFLSSAAAAGGYYWVVSHRPTAPTDEGFATLPVEFGSLSDVISATGKLQPEFVTPIGSELSGKVIEVGVGLSEDVTKGQIVLRLDDRSAKATLNAAQIAVDKARKGLETAKILRDKAQYGVDEIRKSFDILKKDFPKSTKRELELAEIDVRTADANVGISEITVRQAENARDQAQLGLDLTVVRAPADGTIIEKNVFANQLIGPPISAQLFLLAKSLQRLQVMAQVLENDIGKVVVGQKAIFKVNAFGDEDKRFTGKVLRIHPTPTNIPALAQTGLVYYTAVIEAENERDPVSNKWRLLPGMTATVDIVRREHADISKMPVAALNFDMDSSYQSEAAKLKLKQFPQGRKNAEDWKPVWVFNSKKERVPVFVRIGGVSAQGEPGIQDSDYAEVLEWDPDWNPKPNPKMQKDTYPQVIITAPPVSTTTGIFSRFPKIKI